MKEQLSHILDQSVCLTRRQVAAYLEGRMEPEELHAAQMHLASCPLCSLAMDGFEAHTEEGLAALSTLNTDFLKEHFDKSLPQIHLNSVAPAAVIRESRRRRRAGEHTVLPFRRLAAAAALLLFAGGTWWIMQNAGKDAAGNREIAMVVPPPAAADGEMKTPEASTVPAGQPVTAGDGAPVAPAESRKQESGPASVATEATAPVAAPEADDSKALTQEPGAGAVAGTTVHPQNNAAFDTRQTYSRSASPETQPTGNSFQPSQTYNWTQGEETNTDRSRTEKAEFTYVPPALKPTADQKFSVSKSRPAAAPPVAGRADQVERKPAPVNAANLEAARKAVAAGKKEEAKKILQAIVQQGGSEKREARKMLRRMARQEN